MFAASITAAARRIELPLIALWFALAVPEIRRLPYLVASLSVCIPWIPLSSMLMTEVVAYPAFVWAMLAVYRAAVSPRPQNDIVMVVALGMATLARTQFLVLFLV